MSEDPTRIIEEYLTLVRDKLPDSIADDVITELETYMMETARDLGDNGQITVESAKKVVAQFGAPGEVADEYRFSMLPETIDEGDVPSELKETISTSKVEETVPIQKEKEVTRVLGKDPTESYSSLFVRSTILVIIWASITVSIAVIIGSFWSSFWSPLFVIAQACVPIPVLLIHTNNLERKKTLLWTRSFPDWSRIQRFFTLPENAFPEVNLPMLLVDCFFTLAGVGIYLFLYSFSGLGYYMVIFALPIIFILCLRIYYYRMRIKSDYDPTKNGRRELGANVVLLVLINASLFWIWRLFEIGYSHIYSVATLQSVYGLLMGGYLLIQIIVNSENIWWNTQEKEITEEVEEHVLQTKKVGTSVRSNTAWTFVRVVAVLLLYTILPLLTIFNSESFEKLYLFTRTLGELFGEIVAAAFLCVSYYLWRNFMMQKFNAPSIIGTRTRIEALIDLGFSGLLLYGLIPVAIRVFSPSYIQINIDRHQLIWAMGYQNALILIQLEAVSVLIFIVGLLSRSIADAYEFNVHDKQSAHDGIVLSSGIILVGLGLQLTLSTYQTLVSSWNTFSSTYWVYILFVVFFLAFQVSTSSIKSKYIKRKKEHESESSSTVKEGEPDYSRLAN